MLVTIFLIPVLKILMKEFELGQKLCYIIGEMMIEIYFALLNKYTNAVINFNSIPLKKNVLFCLNL